MTVKHFPIIMKQQLTATFAYKLLTLLLDSAFTSLTFATPIHHTHKLSFHYATCIVASELCAGYVSHRTI